MQSVCSLVQHLGRVDHSVRNMYGVVTRVVPELNQTACDVTYTQCILVVLMAHVGTGDSCVLDATWMADLAPRQQARHRINLRLSKAFPPGALYAVFLTAHRLLPLPTSR